ncbi:MAG: helix-turn-helix domain-containing protein [Mycobacterium sp.]
MEQHFSSATEERIIALCNEVTNELGRLVPGVVDEIRRQVPEYDAVDRTEHEVSVTEQYRGLLSGLSERRPPSTEERTRARSLGQRRAREGLTLAATMSAYHIGYREMWNVILQRTDSPAESSELLALVDLVWTWVQHASSAAAEAFEETTRLEDAARTTLLLRLLNGIYGAAVPHADLEHTARALGFDPARAFRVTVSPAESWEPNRLSRYRRQLARSMSGAVAHAEVRGTSLVTISQGVPADDLIATLHRHCSDLVIGVGVERTGLPGAADSATDAEESLLYGRGLRDGGVVWFEEDWLAITLFLREARLAPMLDPYRGSSSLYGDAAVAVSGLIDNGFSFSATGRALHLHPNTVRYRIDRWQQLSGWDVRTRQGLLRSIAALGLAQRRAQG